MRLFDREAREARKEARRARKLEVARLDIEDAFHDRYRWGFADRPSDEDRRDREIGRLIRRYEKLGGNALEIYEVRTSSIAAEAMPEVFEWRPAYPENGWRIYRREEPAS